MPSSGVLRSSSGMGSCHLAHRRRISDFRAVGSLHRLRAASSVYGKDSCHMVEPGGPRAAAAAVDGLLCAGAFRPCCGAGGEGHRVDARGPVDSLEDTTLGQRDVEAVAREVELPAHGREDTVGPNQQCRVEGGAVHQGHGHPVLAAAAALVVAPARVALQLAAPTDRPWTYLVENTGAQHLPRDVNEPPRVLTLLPVLALATEGLAVKAQDVALGVEGVMRRGRRVVLRQPCLRASKPLSASRTTTSKPLRCSATATAAPPMPPPATTMQPHLDTSTAGPAGAAAAPVARFLRSRSRLTIPCCPARPKAHSVLSSSSSLKSSKNCSAAVANAAKSCASSWPAFANAQAMLARSGALKSPARSSADLASAVKSRASDWSALANAHATLEICCAFKSSKHRPAANRCATAVNSCASIWPTLANPHAVFTRSCALNSSRQRTDDLANAPKNRASTWHAFAKAHTPQNRRLRPGLTATPQPLVGLVSSVAKTLASQPQEAGVASCGAKKRRFNMLRRSIDWASAAKSCASSCPAFAKAQTVLASPCALKLSRCRSVERATAVKSSASNCPSFANAQAVWARSCALKPSKRCRAIFATAPKSVASRWPAVANAHAVLASPCGLNSPSRCSATLASAANSCASGWPIVANAHAVFASSCALKAPKCRSASRASAAKSSVSGWPALANAHATLASS
eukprot:scaffold7828_cov70-Phaeocystis_antarctica.AAC.6